MGGDSLVSETGQMDEVPRHQVSEVRLARSEDVPGPEPLDLLDEVNVVLQAEPRDLHIYDLRLEEDRNRRDSRQQDQTFSVDMSSLMWWVVRLASSCWMPGLR